MAKKEKRRDTTDTEVNAITIVPTLAATYFEKIDIRSNKEFNPESEESKMRVSYAVEVQKSDREPSLRRVNLRVFTSSEGQSNPALFFDIESSAIFRLQGDLTNDEAVHAFCATNGGQTLYAQTREMLLLMSNRFPNNQGITLPLVPAGSFIRAIPTDDSESRATSE